MKKLLLLIAFLATPALSQQYVFCNAGSSTICNTSSNPGSGVQGDPAWKAFGKLNSDISILWSTQTVVGTGAYLLASSTLPGTVLSPGGSTIVGTTDSQTLTNKIINATSEVVGSPTGGNQGVGTINVSSGYFLNGSPLPGAANIANGTVLGNNSGAPALPSQQTNPLISGVQLNSPVVDTAGGPFTASSSIFFTDTANAIRINTTNAVVTVPTGQCTALISPFYLCEQTGADPTNGGTVTKGINGFAVDISPLTGYSGGITAVQGRVNLTGTPPIFSTQAANVGLTGIMRVDQNLGGTTGAYANYLGSTYGMNCNAFATSAGTFLTTIKCAEADISLALGSSAAEKDGFSIVMTSADAVRGTYDDAAFVFDAQDPTAVSTCTATFSSGVTNITLTSCGGSNPVLVNNQSITGLGIASTSQISTIVGTCSVSCTVNLNFPTTANETSQTMTITNFVGWSKFFQFGAYAHDDSAAADSIVMGDQCRLTGPTSKRYCPVMASLAYMANTTWTSDIFHFSKGAVVSGSSVVPGTDIYILDKNGNETAQKLTLQNLTTGTAADFACVTAAGLFIIQNSACTISTLRLKENVLPFDGDAVGTLSALDVDYFNLKPTGNADPNANSTQVGLIAENVSQVAPECAVYEDDMKTPKSYRQECVIALLVKAVQQQQAEIAELKARIH